MEPLENQESQLNESLFTESAARVIEKSSGRSPSEIKERSGDQGEETGEAEHETAAHSFSESSLTTVSVKTEDRENACHEKAPRGLRTRSLDEEYTKRHEKEQHGLKARSLDENIKQYATAIRDDSRDSVIPEVHKTNIANTHESLQENRMAPEQDEVASMDFSDEDDRSLEDMKAHEVVVSVDVHEVPILHNWDDIECTEAAKEMHVGKPS
ncbi:hypothetical protein HPB51_004049 [Rhipicephalus microplus]|uniref:Uncharacterized protein n=1 Tax=Rhipicephalus microplus TaxID=6941 RepID=A0A9J6EXB5_RHIMP|nr:hypothetical protein HPB51_004049 [Rhipicephalus microplus]